MKLVSQFINKIEKIHVLYLITFLLIMAFIVFGPSLFGNFVWDDEEQIQTNVIIRNLSNIPYLFTSSTFNTGGAGLFGWYYKPLMTVTFALNYFIWNLNPFGYHLFDMLLHFTNAVLVFFLFKKIFSKQTPFAKSTSFLLSLIFLVHPAITEAVAYVSSTQELLFTFFFLIAFLFTFSFLEKKTNTFLKFFSINLFFLLSLLSKESGIIAIPIIITFIFIFYRSKTLLFVIASFITFSFYLILRFPVAKTPFFQHSKVVPISAASFLERVQTIPFEIFSYIRLTFFPKDLFISQNFVIEKTNDPRFYLTLPFVLLFLFLLFFYFLKTRSKLYLFFLFWLIFAFSILLNLYPLDMTIAERWLYAPLIGILGLFGVVLSNIGEKKNRLFFFLIVLILFVLPLFAIRTFTRTIQWTNELSLFENDIKYNPNSYDLQNNYGVSLFREGKYKEAKELFKRSINLSTSWWASYNNLGVVYEKEGNLDRAKLFYSLAIQNGQYYLAYENLGALKLKTEKPEEAIKFLKNALLYLPYNEQLNRFAAISYYRINATDSAKIYAQRAYKLAPTNYNYNLIQKIMNGQPLE